MIVLNEIFQSGMIFQREKPFCVWGESDCIQTVSVILNGEPIGEFSIKKGAFRIVLPAQSAMENATLRIGECVLENVDFGEVWIAGGQSNMQFYVKWDAERESVYAMPQDDHFRYYEVGKYTFEGEKEDGLKDGSHWDRWLSFRRENSSFFSSAATHFALELRKKLGVPVGIISCNFGGTSASAWLDEKLIREDNELKVYTDEYDASLVGLDMEKYRKVNRFLRYQSYCTREAEDYLHRTEGVAPEEFYAFMSTHQGQPPEGVTIDMSGFSLEELGMTGPNDPHPGSLYQTMLKKIAGISARGVIWYQGCQDEGKARLYRKLLTKLIECWRRDWRDELPFLIAQLAPFGSWWGGTGENFPEIRRAQRDVCSTVPNCYLISTGDAGSETDVHPKRKRKIGKRFALQAFDKIYGIATLADAPTFENAYRDGDALVITFAHADGLHFTGDSVGSLCVYSDGKEVKKFSCEVRNEKLFVRAREIISAKRIRAELAQTGYYEINLFNASDLPALPFKTEVKE